MPNISMLKWSNMWKAFSISMSGWKPKALSDGSDRMCR
jgi:hypothetical protein